MTHLLSDIRYAIRSLRKAPLFTVLATTSIALGIGANVTIFTLLDQVVLRPLPVPRPDQLVQLKMDGSFQGNTWGDGSELSYPMYEDLRDHNRVFSGTFARFGWTMHMNVGERTERVAGELVSGTYFPVLGVRPAQGRLLSPADDAKIGGHPLAVLAYSYWESRFARDPAVVGRDIRLNGHPFTVIGVSEEAFRGIEPGNITQVFVPMMMKLQLTPGWNYLDDRRSRFARVFGRLRPGITAEQAEVALQPFFREMRERELKDEYFTRSSDHNKRRFRQTSLRVVSVPQGYSETRNALREPLWTLMAVVIGVLLIASANVAGLLLTRSMARQREIAIRLAVGGSRFRLVQWLVAESLILAMAGAAIGLLLSTWGAGLLLQFFNRPDAALAVSSTPDARIAFFAAAVAALTGLVFGLVPAVQATSPVLAPTLKDQAGTVVGGGPLRLRKALVVAQVALSLLLLIGAGLFVRSLRNLLAQNTGLDTTNLVAFNVDPSLNGYEPERNRQFASRLVERIRSVPGVVNASGAGIAILEGGSWNGNVRVEGYAAKEGEPPVSYNNTVLPGYFETLGIPLLLGRDFTDADVRTGPPTEGERGIAIANQRFVDRYLKGANPIGRRVGFGTDPGRPMSIEIVGVVGTAKYEAIRNEAEPQLFFAMLTDPNPRSLTVYVRTSADPASMLDGLRAAVREVDPHLPIYDMRTMQAQVERSLSTDRLVAALSTVLGVLATLLAVIGLYGVMAYTVTRRRREVGIRMALGAEARRVALLFVREASLLVLVGFVIGLPTVLAASRYVRSQLYGIEPMDPATIVGAMTGLAAAAAAGALVPALRAARISPLAALREE
jgi:predicted permease